MRKYAVVFEQMEHNWGAYSPDVPGCVATGQTREEVEEQFREALAFHLEGLLEDGLPLPEPSTSVGFVEVEV